MFVFAMLLLAAPQAAASADAQPKIQHAPLLRTPRGETIFVRATIDQPSTLFAPLVFARPAGSQRYDAFTMFERGRKHAYVARLPPAILAEGSFEYFIEARYDHSGGAARIGSAAQPITCVAFDRPPRPVPATFRTDQPGAEVRVDGDPVGTTPLTVPLGPGPHVIQVSASDGRTAEQQLEVRPGTRRIDMLVPLRARAGGPALLAVASDPGGARVLVDGTLVGSTPYDSSLPAGSHTIAVEMDGHRRQERQVLARDGGDLQLQFVLAALPNEPALNVESAPSGALVKVDGKDRGRTPFIGAVPAGEHKVVLSLAGHRDVASEFNMPADRDLLVRLRLAPATSSAPRLTVGSLEGATVRVDGTEVGAAPWTGELRPGTHRVQVLREGAVAEERTVTIQPDQDTELTFAPRQVGPGMLRIETDPAGATVAVDGKTVGESPYSGPLAAGDHLLEISRNGYGSLGQQISIRAGRPLSLKLALPKSSGAAGAPLIAVNSDPEGADVFLDGNLVGRTRWKGPVGPGKHEVVLVLAGYKNGSVPFTVPEGRAFELRLGLSLKPLREAETHAAPSSDDLARAQVRKGEACARLHDWHCAADAFKAAYQIKPLPAILWNVANAQRHLEQYGDAAAAYRAYLKEPDAPPQLRKEATKLLAFCETAGSRQAVAHAAVPLPPEPAKPAPGTAVAAAAPTAAQAQPGAPASATPAQPAAAAAQPKAADSLAIALPDLEEDTAPPVLAHEAISSAERGKSLHLTARITDERSGVGSAQVCWRNLYRTEYACAPLAHKGDDFSAEIPARAVTDGLAYYLEAFDAAGNGPARSGTPDQPNAVAVEDAAFPVRSAVAEATAGGFSTEAREPAGAELAAFQVRRDRAAGAGAAPATPEARAWNVTLLGGAERSSESDTDAIVQSRFGIDASRTLAPGFYALARFDWRNGRQPYVPDPTANPGLRVALDEQRYDVALGLGYDFGALLSDNAISFVPTIGAEYLGIRNGTFPFDSFGPDVGARASFHLVWRVDAQAAIAWAYNATSPETHSALGTIQSHLGSRAGLLLPLGRFALSLDYRNDVLSFSHTYRVAHGATFGFGSSF